MLANGATLGYKASGATEYTDLPGLKEIPDMGSEPEKVENTVLTDPNKIYENGIGDLGDLEYKFKYENKLATSPYRVMRKAQDAGSALQFCETLIDGTKYEYTAQPSVKLAGAGVNGALEFTLKMSVQSTITVTDPATT